MSAAAPSWSQVRLTGHAYPWDVLGDPDFVGRVLEHGLGEVTLACAYHAVRAATPLHPRHQVVTAPTSALYRPVRTEAWAGHRLVPTPADWIGLPDPFGVAAGALRRAGIGVTAWIVLTHNSRLGQSRPDVAVVNCFGDSYPHALCPRWPEVRRYAATLATEALRGADVTGVLLEAWGQHGLAHGSTHDKTAGAWSPAAILLLSVCCCAACQRAWTARGLDPGQVITDLRAAVRDQPPGDRPVETPDALLGSAVAAAIRAVRVEGAAGLLTEVLDALGDVAPGVPAAVFTDPDPWAAAPTSAVDARVSTAVVSAWSVNPGREEALATARAALPPEVTVGAYVTVLPPTDPETVPTHVRRLVAAGAAQLNLYHLGLAGVDRQQALGAAISACRTAATAGRWRSGVNADRESRSLRRT